MKEAMAFLMGMLLSAVGLVLALSSVGDPRKGNAYLLDRAQNIFGNVGLEADAEGNLYIGSRGNVQCFDPEGRFLYGVFISSGYHGWGLDSEGRLCVMDGLHYNLYEDGILTESRELDYDEKTALMKQGMMYHSKRTKVDGKTYSYHFRRVTVTEADGSSYTVGLKIPFWPLSGSAGFGIMFAGILLSWWGLGKIMKDSGMEI